MKEIKNANGFDIDGSTYLHSLLSIADCGSRYIRQNDPGGRPIEALQRVLSDMRRHLSVVGFSEKTVEAGKSSTTTGSDNRRSGSVVVGGEETLVDTLCDFRTAVRSTALAALRESENASEHELSKRILSICDGLRDDALPKIGLEISDDSSDSAWKVCLPRREGEGGASPTFGTKPAATIGTMMKGVGTVEMFTVGMYSGKFSKYDAQGIPTHNLDGSEISKRLRKKLMKKMAKKIKK